MAASMADLNLSNLLYLFIAYCVGGLPYGLLVARLFRLGDLRKIGSGNIGATNVLRAGGIIPAALTLFFDVFKGIIAVSLVIITEFGSHSHFVAMAGLGSIAAVLGHCYSPFIGFKGGKGVATGIGIMFAYFSFISADSIFIDLLPFFAVVAVWLGVFAVARISSLASIAAFIAAPIVMFLVDGNSAITVASIAVSAVIIWRHKANIYRLLTGTEARIGG